MADKNKRRGIATLSDLRNKAARDSDSDSDGPQEYYTGGEKSGMMVQDPSKHRQDMDSFFDRVRQAGGRNAVPAPPSNERSGAFMGAGRTLAGDAPPEAPEVNQPPEPVSHAIVFYTNGFTVNDGPLRRLDDPANQTFLESIGRGQVPAELESGNPAVAIDVNLIRRDEEWKPPAEPREPRVRAFAGTGRALGRATPSEETVTHAPYPAAPFRGIVVDEQQPSTSVQLRLADGTRMVARFNHHHTVGDIRGFIDAARAGGPKLYALQVMGFPPKILTDPSLTIEQAGLANSVIIQKC